MKKYFALITIVLFCLQGQAKNNNVHNKLHHTVKQIKSTKKKLKKDQHKQHQLDEKLKAIERTIGHISQNFDATQTQLNQKIMTVSALKTQHRKLKQLADQQHHELKKLIRQAYISAHSHKATKLNRMAAYEHYISKQYTHQIDKIHHTMNKLKINQQQILAQTTALTKLRDQLNKQTHDLSAQKSLREQTMRALSKKIQSERDRLKKLTADKAHFEKVIAQLQQSSGFSAKYFIEHKHKMPWPVSGKMTVKFGDPIKDSKLTSSGVEIAAPLNTPVHAIAPGKVVFNDWMAGFGLLLIIDHGQGYMSVYGHNNATCKHTGDLVDAGEVIAKVGSSGGIDKSELYLNIRYNGKSLDPSNWCT